MRTIIEKELVKKEDGISAAVGLYVKEENLSLEVSVDYPLEKIIEPAAKAVDKLVDKLEAAIPGSWDKPLLEKLKKEFRSELVDFLAK